eukprot:2810783-Pyramimonas_sp.AAC.1
MRGPRFEYKPPSVRVAVGSFSREGKATPTLAFGVCETALGVPRTVLLGCACEIASLLGVLILRVGVLQTCRS